MKQSDAVRFWEKVAKSDGCWLWTGAIFKSGYAAFRFSEKTGRAHRFSWELHKGPIPDGLLVLHECDVRRCVNPNHLFVGTPKANMEDMVAKGRRVIGSGSIEGRKGEAHFISKLTDAAVLDIRSRRAGGEILKSIAKDYGMSIGAIHNAARGATWSHV